jgi:hypothetical protein
VDIEPSWMQEELHDPKMIAFRPDPTTYERRTVRRRIRQLDDARRAGYRDLDSELHGINARPAADPT